MRFILQRPWPGFSVVGCFHGGSGNRALCIRHFSGKCCGSNPSAFALNSRRVGLQLPRQLADATPGRPPHTGPRKTPFHLYYYIILTTHFVSSTDWRKKWYNQSLLDLSFDDNFFFWGKPDVGPAPKFRWLAIIG